MHRQRLDSHARLLMSVVSVKRSAAQSVQLRSRAPNGSCQARSDTLAATRVPVITVVAPPGYGKTTLMAQWAQRSGSRVAWLSCDDADNDRHPS